MDYVVNIFVIFGSIATMVIAYCTLIGLSRWKKQHSGKMEYDLAVRLLASIYKYRRAMYHFMNWSMVSFPDSSENEQSLSEKHKERVNNELKSYKKVTSLLDKIDDDILTSPDSWRKKLGPISEKMRKIATDVAKIVENKSKIDNPDIESGHPVRHAAEEELKKIRECPTYDYKELEKRHDKLVKEAEDFLRPKIEL